LAFSIDRLNFTSGDSLVQLESKDAVKINSHTPSDKLLFQLSELDLGIVYEFISLFLDFTGSLVVIAKMKLI